MRKLPGFTLIELLVVVSIIGVLSGMSLVGYNRFNDRQVVLQAAHQLASDLRLAQQKALSGEKPAGCSGDLQGWRLELGVSSYQFIASCDSDVTSNSRALPEDISASPTTAVEFSVLTGAVASGAGDITVSGTFAGILYSNTVTVTVAGGISVE